MISNKGLRYKYRWARAFSAIRSDLRKFMPEGDPDALAIRLFDWVGLIEPEVFDGYGRRGHRWQVSAVLVLQEGMMKFQDEEPMVLTAIHEALGTSLQRAKTSGINMYEFELLKNALELFMRQDFRRKKLRGE